MQRDISLRLAKGNLGVDDPSFRIILDDSECSQKVYGPQGGSNEGVGASDHGGHIELDVSPGVFEFAVNEMTIDKLRIVDDDSRIIYGPVSNFFQRLKIS